MLAVIALGTNIGNRLENLGSAVGALSLLPQTRVIKASAVYETAPVGYLEQSDFYNAAVLLETELSPCALLGGCLGIEAALGRIRQFKNGPRCIDLDLLLYEGFTSNGAELTVPHPRMKERAFVLVPLSDIFPDSKALGFDFAPALSRLDCSTIRKTPHIIELSNNED